MDVERDEGVLCAFLVQAKETERVERDPEGVRATPRSTLELVLPVNVSQSTFTH